MPRPDKTPFSIVDPDAPQSDAGVRHAERLLIGGGWSPKDAKWLVPLLLNVLPQCGDGASCLSDSTEIHFDLLSQTWRMAGGDRDAALLLLLATLTNCVHIPRLIAPATPETSDREVWAMPDDASDIVVAEFRRHEVSFNDVLRVGWPEYLVGQWATDMGAGVHDRFRTFFGLLLRTGAVDLCRIIDINALREIGKRGSWYPVGFSMIDGAFQWSDGGDWLDPHSLRVWVWFSGLDALRRFTPAFLDEPLETLPALAMGVAQVAAFWVGRPGPERQYDAFDEAGAEFASVMRSYFERLESHPESSIHDAPLHQAWMLFFRMAWDADPSACPKALRKRALSIAIEDLARLRKLFSAATCEGETDEAKAFSRQLSHFDQCCNVLSLHGGVWRCMKPLLLALRSLGTRAVARDLRYWDEFVEDQPPHPWCAIPTSMISLFHAHIGKEQQSDADLNELRAALAQFLLDKLTDRWSKAEREAAEKAGTCRTNDEMKEPDPAWRYCMVRAIMDLRINPEGRGHRALYWSSKNDPDPRVIEIAGRGYEQLRHYRKLPERTSPRRAIMSAIWWIRQAHLLGLGIQPDPDGAQRTRVKELTRTKETERGDNLAI